MFAYVLLDKQRHGSIQVARPDSGVRIKGCGEAFMSWIGRKHMQHLSISGNSSEQCKVYPTDQLNNDYRYGHLSEVFRDGAASYFCKPSYLMWCSLVREYVSLQTDLLAPLVSRFLTASRRTNAWVPKKFDVLRLKKMSKKTWWFSWWTIDLTISVWDCDLFASMYSF